MVVVVVVVLANDEMRMMRNITISQRVRTIPIMFVHTIIIACGISIGVMDVLGTVQPLLQSQTKTRSN